MPKLTNAAKARNAAKRKSDAEKVHERIKAAVKKAVVKRDEYWKAKLAAVRAKQTEDAQARVQKACAKEAERRRKKTEKFWLRKVQNGCAYERSVPEGQPRQFAWGAA